MIEIHLLNGNVDTFEDCTCRCELKTDRLTIMTLQDKETVIAEYNLKNDVLKVVKNGNPIFRSYMLKKFGDRIVMK